MTDCDKIQQILPAYLEGLASPAESEMISSHLGSCSKCNAAVQAFMKSQKLISNLEEVEPPPWLKTRIMARLEEGVEQEEEKRWGFGALRDLLLYPLKVKIPLQAFALLVVAVMAAYVYRVTQPDVRMAEQSAKNVATVPATGEKKDLAPESTGLPKTQKDTTPAARPQPQPPSQVQSPAKVAPEEAGGWPSGIREIFKGGAGQQPSPPPALKMPPAGTIKDQDTALQAAAEPEGVTRTKSAKPAPPGSPSASGSTGSPVEGDGRGRAETKTESEKGVNIAAAARQETVALIVQVTDINTGTNDVEAMLRSLGAPIARESKEGYSMISTQAAPSKAKEIIKRLGTVGQVQQRSQFPETSSDRPVSLRIQVLQKQP